MKEFYVKKTENLDSFIKTFRDQSPAYDRVEIDDKQNAWKVMFYKNQPLVAVPPAPTKPEPVKNPAESEVKMDNTKKEPSMGEFMASFVKAQYANDLNQFRAEMDKIQKETVAEAQKAKNDANAAIDGINKAVQNGLAQMTSVIEKAEAENKSWRDNQTKKLEAVGNAQDAETAKRQRMAQYLKGLPE